MRLPGLFLVLLLLLAVAGCNATGGEVSPAMQAEHCPDYKAGVKNLYWGDLHVHTAYSLDAYGYGTVATPADAYRFAKGAPLELPDGRSMQLARPLDFTAVTDHAEWFDLLYICTHPLFDEDEYCTLMREKSNPFDGGEVFANYVIPTITLARPRITPICANRPQACAEAAARQWQRVQEQAHAAYAPCEFTSFVGFEWSATPAYSHNHRNVIFASENVTDKAIDAIRYPHLDEFWAQLDARCRPEEGCDAIAIPHNSNMGDGFSFDVETDGQQALELRARFERLVEIHQEKGNSECLAPFGAEDDNDCAFELYLTRRSRPRAAGDFNREDWEQMRKTYARSLLLRGLEAYAGSGEHHRNPLQLGFIGSTDNHTATPGHVEEDQWPGSAFGLGDFERALSRIDWNPGGLVAVWAEENTRASLFAALQRREVYATSGPRIGLRVAAEPGALELSCAAGAAAPSVPMGGEFSAAQGRPVLRIIAEPDLVPLERIDVIKGEWRDGEARETVFDITPAEGVHGKTCLIWSDPDFDADAPAFWYVRVEQQATPRWTAVLCKAENRCEDYPAAARAIRERAWSSPIWYRPIR